MNTTNLMALMDNLELIHATGRYQTRFKEIPKFKEGLYKLDDCVYAWMVPNGSWGESNAGLVLGKEESLLVDTLWDLECTREMLDSLKSLTDKSPIKNVINTHADGDHFFGLDVEPIRLRVLGEFH